VSNNLFIHHQMQLDYTAQSWVIEPPVNTLDIHGRRCAVYRIDRRLYAGTNECVEYSFWGFQATSRGGSMRTLDLHEDIEVSVLQQLGVVDGEV
jgi:hypothetical protein